MTYEEAIRFLRECMMPACEYHIKNKCGRSYESIDKAEAETKEMAISALEKQIPKKPKGIMCPECGHFITQHSGVSYCWSCGQAIVGG